MNLAGKRALITGGGIRLGRAISLGLAAAGCHVFIHYHRSQGQALEVRDEARLAGVKAEIFSSDLGDPSAPAATMAAAVEALGAVDILVNNAAIFLEGSLAETSRHMWESQFALNLSAPFFLSQAFAAQLPPGTAGRIVNVCDARTLRAGTDHLAYRLTKQGLWHMTELLALELAPAITVNAVALGFMLPVAGSHTEPEEYAAHHVPLGRVGNADIVVENVLHLLRQDFTTGAVLRLDGGEYL